MPPPPPFSWPGWLQNRSLFLFFSLEGKKRTEKRYKSVRNWVVRRYLRSFSVFIVSRGAPCHAFKWVKDGFATFFFSRETYGAWMDGWIRKKEASAILSCDLSPRWVCTSFSAFALCPLSLICLRGKKRTLKRFLNVPVCVGSRRSSVLHTHTRAEFGRMCFFKVCWSHLYANGILVQRRRNDRLFGFNTLALKVRKFWPECRIIYL